MSEYEFGILGPLQVVVDGRAISIGGPQPRTLISVLLAHRNHEVSTSTLIEGIWGEEPPATAHKSIQKYVSQLRKHVGDRLSTGDGGYSIVTKSDEVDADRFKQLIEQARKSDNAAHLLKQALDLWRGDPYSEVPEVHVVRADITRLAELRLEAEELLVEARLAAGEHNSLVGDVETLVAENPYREKLWALLMLALYRSGRQSEALDTYRRVRHLLGEELGIDPSTELQELEERILMHDPSLQPTAAGAANLPAPLTSFIGRTDELDHIHDLLLSTRLVTLVGPAGSGKTRLALEVGRSMVRDVEGGVWFVDLAPVRSPDQVVEAIGAPLGVTGGPERTTHDVLTDYLSSRHLTMIFDNCEHLISRVAEVTQALLRAAPELTVIATSRQRLGVDGEVVFDVPPLAYPDKGSEATEEFDAVRLFIERSRSVTRDLDLEAGRSTIGEIVRRLDGIPLAIELAASRVRTLGLEELRERLDDRFAVLTSPSAAPLERHRTLEAAIDWSYQLLPEQERLLLQRLSVFRGSFGVAAATEVCGESPLSPTVISDLLGELFDKSFLARKPVNGGRHRYLLLETIREFASAQLDPGQSSPLRDNHSRYYLSFAENAATKFNGPEQDFWFRRMNAEHANLRKALSWAAATDKDMAVRLAVAMGKYWDSVGPRTEGHEWLLRAVKMSERLNPELRIDALLQASELFSSHNADLPRQFAEEALEISEKTGNRLGLARSLCALTWALALAEEPDSAIAAGQRAVPILEELDNSWELALCLERLGQASYQHPQRSVELFERSCRIYAELGDRVREALTLYKMADRLAHSLNEIEQAKEYARRSLAILEDTGNVNDRAHASLEYGKILRRAGEPDEAVDFLEDALDNLSKSGDERCSVRAMTALGLSQLEAGDRHAATESLSDALRRGRALDERHTTRAALAGLARAIQSEGREEDAVILLALVDTLSRLLKTPVSDTTTRKRAAELKTLRQLVGSDRFDELWQEGSAISLEEALEIALSTRATTPRRD